MRRSGEPYLVHPLNVAAILADLKADDVSIVVGLLHDVLEDTLTTREAIAQQFGHEVADLVDGRDEDRQASPTSPARRSRPRPSAR